MFTLLFATLRQSFCLSVVICRGSRSGGGGGRSKGSSSGSGDSKGSIRAAAVDAAANSASQWHTHRTNTAYKSQKATPSELSKKPANEEENF